MVDLGERATTEEVPDGYRMTELGVLPEDWRVVRLTELAYVRYGKARPQSSGVVPVVGSGGVYGYSGDALVQGPTIVVGRKGTAGISYLFHEPCWPSDTTFYLDWRSSDVLPNFLYNWMRLRPLSGKEAQTTLPSLQKPVLENLLVPLPPLPEQRAIAHVLSTVQRAREATEAVIAATRELKRSLMRHLFTYGPVPLDQVAGVRLKETEIGFVPEGWDIRPLGKIAAIERGKFTHRPRNDPAYYGGDTPFIQTGDVTASNGVVRSYSQTLSERGLSVSRIFPEGTIVITIAANIGYTAILGFDSAFPDSLIGITPCPGVQTRFLNYYLMTQQSAMDRAAPRGTQKNINIQFLSPWLVPVPPPSDQAAIESAIRAVDQKLMAAENGYEVLNMISRAALSGLMSGRIRAQ